MQDFFDYQYNNKESNKNNQQQVLLKRKKNRNYQSEDDQSEALKLQQEFMQSYSVIKKEIDQLKKEIAEHNGENSNYVVDEPESDEETFDDDEENYYASENGDMQLQPYENNNKFDEYEDRYEKLPDVRIVPTERFEK